MALDKIKTSNYSRSVKNSVPIFAEIYNKAVDQINADTAAIDALEANASAGTVLTKGTSSTPSDAHTINAPAGNCIISHGAVAALGTRTVTITNSFATATSVVVASINTYGGNGTPLVKEVTPAAGSIVIEIYNAHATDALSANFGLAFAILA